MYLRTGDEDGKRPDSPAPPVAVAPRPRIDYNIPTWDTVTGGTH